MKSFNPIDLRRRSFMPLRLGFIILYLLVLIGSLFCIFPLPLPGTFVLLMLAGVNLQFAYLAFVAKDQTLYRIRETMRDLADIGTLFN